MNDRIARFIEAVTTHFGAPTDTWRDVALRAGPPPAPGETIVYAVGFLDIHQAFLAKDPNGCLSATSCCGTSSSMPPMSRARTRKETRLKEADFPLVRGGKIPRAALLWLAELERVFPGATKDIIIIRNSSSAPLREAETGGNPIAQESERKWVKR
jgi:hypothetical protein